MCVYGSSARQAHYEPPGSWGMLAVLHGQCSLWAAALNGEARRCTLDHTQCSVVDHGGWVHGTTRACSLCAWTSGVFRAYSKGPQGVTAAGGGGGCSPGQAAQGMTARPPAHQVSARAGGHTAQPLCALWMHS